MSTLNAAISASAMALAVERVRIEVAVSNLANAQSTRGPDGEAFRRRDVVVVPEPVSAFDAALGTAGATGVKVAGIVLDETPFRRRYEPSHPDADADGFVAFPNIDPSEEMVNMLGAARAYQANLSAIGIIRDMVAKALELGR